MKILIFFFLLYPFLSNARIDHIYNTKTNKIINFDQFVSQLDRSSIIVLGEFHNNDLIQSAQAQIIENVVQSRNLFGNFNVGWEFLNYSDQTHIDQMFKKVFTNAISIQEFLTKTAGIQNLSYEPIIQVLKNKSGKILGLNIERRLKQKLINEGEDSIKEHLPSNYEVGGQLYKQRFFKAMGGHVADDMKLSYFKAQCLTDSVMSLKLIENHSSPLSFIIAGSFHTDFYQGTVSRLKKLTAENITTLKIVDSSAITPEQLQDIIDGDVIYGRYADYIVVTAPQKNEV